MPVLSLSAVSILSASLCFLAIIAGMVVFMRSREALLRRKIQQIVSLLVDAVEDGKFARDSGEGYLGEGDRGKGDLGRSDLCSSLAALHSLVMLRLDKGSEFPLAAQGVMRAPEDRGVDGIIDNSLCFLLERCRDELKAAAVLVQQDAAEGFVVRELLGWSGQKWSGQTWSGQMSSGEKPANKPSVLIDTEKYGPRTRRLVERLIGSLRYEDNDIRDGCWSEISQTADGLAGCQERLDAVCALAGFGFGQGYILPFEMSSGTRGMLWCCGYPESSVSGKSRRLIFAVVSYLAAQLAPSLAMSQALSRQSRENEFLVGASHDLRSPLSYALAELREMIKSEEGLGGRQREVLADVVDCLEGQGEVISNVLDVARDHAGLLKAQPGCFSLAAVLGPVIRRFSRLAERKGLSFVVSSDQDLLVKFDRQHLQRIVGNLLSNALKYTSHGSITVCFELDSQFSSAQLSSTHLFSTRLSSTHRASSVCRIRVSDTGCGLGAEEAQRVFEKFYRSGTVGEAPGIGYGLSISRVLAEINSGQIYYQANAEGGADFVLELPLLERGSVVSGPELYCGVSDRWVSDCLLKSGAEVLIIDDEPAICRLNSRYLSADNLHVMTAESMEVAKELLLQRRPEIVISDIDIAGHSLFDWVQAEPELWRGQPMIIVSGASCAFDMIPDEINDALCLAKPLQREDLRSAVAEILHRASL